MPFRLRGRNATLGSWLEVYLSGWTKVGVDKRRLKTDCLKEIYGVWILCEC